MIFYELLHLLEQPLKNDEIGTHEGALLAVASSQVLARDYRRDFALLAFYEEQLAVVVCEVGRRYHLADERPQLDCFVRCFVVENKVILEHILLLLYEVQAANKLLRDRERCLPDAGWAELLEDPFQDVCDLQLVRKIRLRLFAGERQQVVLYVDSSFHESD